jgi:hypothetical protein
VAEQVFDVEERHARLHEHGREGVAEAVKAQPADFLGGEARGADGALEARPHVALREVEHRRVVVRLSVEGDRPSGPRASVESSRDS